MQSRGLPLAGSPLPLVLGHPCREGRGEPKSDHPTSRPLRQLLTARSSCLGLGHWDPSFPLNVGGPLSGRAHLRPLCQRERPRETTWLLQPPR